MEWIALFALILVLAVAGWIELHKLFHETVVWDYEAALHYRHGKFQKQLSAGRHKLYGKGHEVKKFDLRSQELVVQGQELITADKATIRLTLVGSYRIEDPLKVMTHTVNPAQDLYTRLQLALRDVVGDETLEDLLKRKGAYGKELMARVAEGATSVGLKLEAVAVRDIILCGDLKQAYAGVLAARHHALAELEKARGQAAALRTLANSARLFEKNPQLMQLKFLQTLESTAMGNTLIIGNPDKWGMEAAR